MANLFYTQKKTNNKEQKVKKRKINKNKRKKTITKAIK